MSKVTMKDVARQAGVSVATVSNVLNNITNKTNEETRDKVLKAVKEMNYQMDMTARSLSMGKSKLLGIFLPEVFFMDRPSSVLKDNPFFSEIVSGIEYEARMEGYDVMITCVNSVDHANELIHKRMLDGVALLGMHHEQFWNNLKNLSIPIVLIDSYCYEQYGFCNVGTEDEQGAYLATKHLLSLNHRHIALVTDNSSDSEVNHQRFLGYKRAIKESGVDEELCPIIKEDLNFKGGIMAGHKLLNYNYVTAAFVVADIMALGIIKLMNQIGKSIPKDLSIIGFDDLSVCNYSFPGLTTIRQDIYRKGREVAKLLINKINGNEVEAGVRLPIELIVRETTIPNVTKE